MDHGVFCNSIETIDSHFKKKESKLSGGKVKTTPTLSFIINNPGWFITQTTPEMQNGLFYFTISRQRF